MLAAAPVLLLAALGVSPDPGARWTSEPLASFFSDGPTDPGAEDEALEVLGRAIQEGRFVDARQALDALPPFRPGEAGHIESLLLEQHLMVRQFAFPGSAIWVADDAMHLRPELFVLQFLDANLDRKIAALDEADAAPLRRLSTLVQAEHALVSFRSVLRVKQMRADATKTPPEKLRAQVLAGRPADATGSEAALWSHMEAELAWAAGERGAAVRIAGDAEAAARRSSRWCAAAGLALLRGDVLAAPFGPVETQGVDMAALIDVNAPLRMGILPPALEPADPKDLKAALGAYRVAEDLAARGGCRNASLPLELRMAFHAWRRSRPDASARYRKAAADAAGAGDRRLAGLASLQAALIGHRPAEIPPAVEAAVASADVGLALAISRLVQLRATTWWRLNDDPRRATEVLEPAARALREAGLPLAAGECWLLEGEVLSDSGREELAIAASSQVVQVRAEVVQRAEADAQRAFSGSEVPKAYRTAMESQRLALFDAKQQLMTSYGQAALSEGSPRWFERYRALRAELEPLLAEAERNGSTARPDFAQIEMVLSLREALAFPRGGQERASALARTRARAGEMGGPFMEMLVDAAVSEEDPAARDRVARVLEKMEPVAALSSALDARAANRSTAAVLDVARAMGLLEVLASTAERAHADELLGRWADQAEKLSAHHPEMRALAELSLYAQALVAFSAKDYPRARQRLASLLDGGAPVSDARRAQAEDLRMEVMVASGEAEAALLLAEARADRELGVQVLRSGGDTSSAEAMGERLGLERMAALGAALSEAQSKRLGELRARTGALLRGFSAPSLKELRAALGALSGRTLLVLRPGRRWLVLWRFSPGQGLTAQLLDTHQGETFRLAEQLSRLASAEEGEGLKAVERALYDQVIGPAGPLRPGEPVVLIASGSLSRLPFEALVSPDGATFGVDHAVVMADRIAGVKRALGLPRRLAPRGAKAVVVGSNGADLVFAQDEAAEVAEVLKVEPLLPPDATVARVIAAAADARIVHIAAHGALVRTNPFLSFVELAGGERLEAWRWLQEPTGAELVVLSACESAAGIDPRGHGESGSLATAAHAAGARWVIASRWKVDDASTAEFFHDFYGAYDAAGPEEALRRTRAARAKAHPYRRDAFELSVRSVEDLSPVHP